MPVANIVFPHPADAVAVARSTEAGELEVEHVSPGDWLQVGPRLFGGAQVPVGVASPHSDSDEVIVFLDEDGFETLAGIYELDSDAEAFGLCAARSGDHVALRVRPEPSPPGLVLMDHEVRALAAGALLMVGEAADEHHTGRLDRALAVPLPASLVSGVVKAVDLL
ncbi:MAG: hypothetical protein ACR2GL_01095 [Thermoleophilaceae bacterium]